MKRIALLILAAACRTPKPLNTVRLSVDTVQQSSGVPVVGPVTWMHEDGLSLEIPEGWSGLEDASHALSITHTSSDVRLEIMHPHEGELESCGRPGWEAHRRRATKSRAFPEIGPLDSWSATANEPRGGSRDCWLVPGLSATYMVAVEFPFGNVVGGRTVIAPLLSSVRRMTSPGDSPQTP